MEADLLERKGYRVPSRRFGLMAPEVHLPVREVVVAAWATQRLFDLSGPLARARVTAGVKTNAERRHKENTNLP